MTNNTYQNDIKLVSLITIHAAIENQYQIE